MSAVYNVSLTLNDGELTALLGALRLPARPRLLRITPGFETAATSGRISLFHGEVTPPTFHVSIVCGLFVFQLGLVLNTWSRVYREPWPTA